MEKLIYRKGQLNAFIKALRANGVRVVTSGCVYELYNSNGEVAFSLKERNKGAFSDVFVLGYNENDYSPEWVRVGCWHAFKSSIKQYYELSKIDF